MNRILFREHKRDGFVWTSDDDYTHAIVINTCMPELKPSVTREHVLGLAFEPNDYLNISTEFVLYAQQYIGRYFIGDAHGFPPPFVSRFSYMWHIPPPLTPIPVKSNIISMVVSYKKTSWGNRYRHRLANAILAANLPVDIWGNGCYLLDHPIETRVRGRFDEKEPYETYMFHIAIENFQCGHYISEKLLNPFVYQCTPLYWGSPLANHYFGDTMYALSGNIGQDLRLIEEICSDPELFKKPIHSSVVARVTDVLCEFAA